MARSSASTTLKSACWARVRWDACSTCTRCVNAVVLFTTTTTLRVFHLSFRGTSVCRVVSHHHPFLRRALPRVSFHESSETQAQGFPCVARRGARLPRLRKSNHPMLLFLSIHATQANADAAGVETFETAFFKVCGLTVAVPNVLGAIVATAPATGAALSPLNTVASFATAWFGAANRGTELSHPPRTAGTRLPILVLSEGTVFPYDCLRNAHHDRLTLSGLLVQGAMRRRFNITGVSECAWVCACSKFMFDGDAERTDDFCCYLCCFPCAVCQETRHLRRHNLGTIAGRFKPYDDGNANGNGVNKPYAAPSPAHMRHVPGARVVHPGESK